MALAKATKGRAAARAKALNAWEKECGIALGQLDEGQQWVVFAALQARSRLGRLPALLRLLAYVLAHCGMGLSAPLIASLTSVSDRAIRATKALTADELLHGVRTPPCGKPKLGPEHAGIVAKFLVERPKPQVNDVLAFVKREIGIEIDRKTLRVYIARYGLGCLRGDLAIDTPLLSGTRASGGRSS